MFTDLTPLKSIYLYLFNNHDQTPDQIAAGLQMSKRTVNNQLMELRNWNLVEVTNGSWNCIQDSDTITEEEALDIFAHLVDEGFEHLAS